MPLSYRLIDIGRGRIFGNNLIAVLVKKKPLDRSSLRICEEILRGNSNKSFAVDDQHLFTAVRHNWNWGF